VQLTDPLRSRKKKAPLCLNCLKRKSRKIARIGHYGRFTIFCTPACAIMYACKSVLDSSLTWCVKHQQWTNNRGKCGACDIEKAVLEQLGDGHQFGGDPAGEEVAHA
jgi:hypothetical protein